MAITLHSFLMYAASSGFVARFSIGPPSGLVGFLLAPYIPARPFFALTRSPTAAEFAGALGLLLFHWQCFACFVWLPPLVCDALAGKRERFPVSLLQVTPLSGWSILTALLVGRISAFVFLCTPAFFVLAFLIVWDAQLLLPIVLGAGLIVLCLFYVGAVSLAFSAAARSASEAYGRTLLCLAVLGIVPAASPWQLLLLVDCWNQSLWYMAFGAATIIFSLFIPFRALRQAHYHLEDPDDLVGVKQSIDEPAPALALNVSSRVGGMLFASLFSGVTIPAMSLFAYGLSNAQLALPMMVWLMLQGPAVVGLLVLLGDRLLLSDYFERRTAMTVMLLASPLNAFRLMTTLLLRKNQPLRAGCIVFLACWASGGLLCGARGLLLGLLLAAELSSVAALMFQFRLLSGVKHWPVVYTSAYLFGVWGLPFVAAGSVESFETTMFVVAAAGSLFLIANSGAASVVVLVALRHGISAAMLLAQSPPRPEIRQLAPAYFFTEIRVYGDGFLAAIAPTLSGAAYSVAMCLLIFGWLYWRFDAVAGRARRTYRPFSSTWRRRADRARG